MKNTISSDKVLNWTGQVERSATLVHTHLSQGAALAATVEASCKTVVTMHAHKGKLHNLTGPAVVCENSDDDEYWINGMLYDRLTYHAVVFKYKKQDDA